MLRRFRNLVALVLVALWLPVTLCCALEAAGSGALCCGERCHQEDAAASAATCSIVEDGDYYPSAPTLNVAPQLFVSCLDALRGPALDLKPAEIDVARHGRAAEPEDWVPIWQFERRAAAPAHAPDSLLA